MFTINVPAFYKSIHSGSLALNLQQKNACVLCVRSGGSRISPKDQKISFAQPR